jgi:hypothetical protein
MKEQRSVTTDDATTGRGNSAPVNSPKIRHGACGRALQGRVAEGVPPGYGDSVLRGGRGQEGIRSDFRREPVNKFGPGCGAQGNPAPPLEGP